MNKMRNAVTYWLLLAGAPAAAAGLQFEGAAEPLMPGMVTRAHHEVQASLHADGNLVLFGCSDCPLARGGDLFQVQRSGGRWIGPGRAKPSLTVNESAPAFTPEGGWLYYVSDHGDGFGGTDLFRVAYSPVRQQFATPENLGPAVNSKGDEGAASAGRDGHYLVFASKGRKGARGWDLFETRRVDGRLAPATRLAGLDTAADEFDPALLAGDAGLVFARGEAGGASALWFAPRRGQGFGAPVKLPAPVNQPGSSARAPQQDHTDPHYLLFTRIGADGGSDILRIRYRVLED